MKLYIAGPMSGIKAFNFPAFDEVAASLRALGHEVISPAELDDPEFRLRAMRAKGTETDLLQAWGACLARDVKLITDEEVDAIVLIHDWWKSRGATLEATVGLLNGVEFFQYVGGLLDPISNVSVLSAMIDGWTHRGTIGERL